MRKYIYAVSILLLYVSSTELRAQGCVAVKNMSSCSFSENGQQAKGWQFSLNYRFFRSYKHFVGTHEETHRTEEGTEVINNDNSFNLGLSYNFNNRWSASLIIPLIYIDRSSMYEHLGNSSPQNPNPNNPNFERFHTQASGLGDIRLIGYYNAFSSKPNAGLMLGLGVKVPTGKYDAKDNFTKRDSEGNLYQEERLVDQSIQPGDGGTGIITEIDFNHKIKGKFYGYGNVMYMFNARNTNGVMRSQNLTTIPSTGETIPLSNEFSVVDQYLIRAGARYQANGIQASLGGRMECIPSKDLIGKSDGFRRPGYIVSVEPSVLYSTGPHSFGVSFPIAVERNRTRSQIDIARGTNPQTGAKYHGDAAFADWLVSVSYAYRLAK
ncbi:MAG: hypothetical protein ACOYXT_11710 [Bacteroidota bacterium]